MNPPVLGVANALPALRVAKAKAQRFALSSPGSPTPRSATKERAPSGRVSHREKKPPPAPAAPAPSPPQEPVSAFRNNPFLLADRKKRQPAPVPPEPTNNIPTVSKAQEAKAKLIELLRTVGSSTTVQGLQQLESKCASQSSCSSKSEAVEILEPGRPKDAEASNVREPNAEGTARANEEKLPGTEAAADTIAPESEAHTNADAACAIALAPDAAVHEVHDANGGTLADWVCSGALSNAELAATAAQLLPQIEHELKLARAAERKAEPLVQVLRREQRASKRARTRR